MWKMIILKLNRVEYILTFMMRIIKKSSHSEHSFLILLQAKKVTLNQGRRTIRYSSS